MCSFSILEHIAYHKQTSANMCVCVFDIITLFSVLEQTHYAPRVFIKYAGPVSDMDYRIFKVRRTM